MRVIDAINDPGRRRGAGDDRFGFDEAAGRAWVIDGATDVGDIRVFDGESDAGWWAEALSRRLVEPSEIETVESYFRGVIAAAADDARRASRVDLGLAPGHSLPCAAGMWLRRRSTDAVIELAWLGDCVAVIHEAAGAVRVFGEVDDIEAEARANRAWHAGAADPAERRRRLQENRAAATGPGAPWVFSLDPHAAAHLGRAEIAAPGGGHALLASDGFYRLVATYQRFDPVGLLVASVEEGLGALIGELRGLETDPADDARYGRVKRSDDAAAVLIAFD